MQCTARCSFKAALNLSCGFDNHNEYILLRNLILQTKYHERRKSTYYITTPMFYVNSSPHIGHLYTMVLADATARFERMKNPGVDLKFMSGTDEHGQKISVSAQENKMDEQKYCDMISNNYRNMFDNFNISYTDFLRTTETRHKRTVAKLWNIISEKGYIFLDEHSGWYCIADETFVLEQYLLPEEIPGVRYTIEFNKPAQYVKELNYKFKLGEFKDDLLHWLKRDGVVKPEKFQKILKNMIIEGNFLGDLSISRPSSRMSWGIPVPNDPSQNIYVWLDALTSYLTSIEYLDSKNHWPPNLQIIGKDILKFHGVYWPAFLIAAGLEPPQCILCHSHWLNEGKKMSKSLGNVIDPMKMANICTTEGFRFFLLQESVPHSDGNFHELEVNSVINAGLADKLGNFLQRCLGKALNPGGIFPSYSPNHAKYIENQADVLIKSLETLPDSVFGHYENFLFNEGICRIMQTMTAANKFFEEATPWKIKDPNHLLAILHISMETLRVCGILLQPIVPEISKNLLDRLSIPENERSFESIRPFSWQRTDKAVDVTLPKSKEGLFKRIIVKK